MTPTLADFEDHIELTCDTTGRSGRDWCEIIGLSYSTYRKIRCGSEPLHRQTMMHIDTLMRLPAESFQELVAERLELSPPRARGWSAIKVKSTTKTKEDFAEAAAAVASKRVYKKKTRLK